MSSVMPEEMVQLSVAVSRAELAQLQLASGVIGVEAWARSVMLDLAGDLTKVEAAADSAHAEMRPTAGSEPLLVVGETALLLEQIRDLRDEVRRSLAEQQLWLQILYAEVRAQAAFTCPAQEIAACTRAGEQLTRMKQLIAAKLER